MTIATKWQRQQRRKKALRLIADGVPPTDAPLNSGLADDGWLNHLIAQHPHPEISAHFGAQKMIFSRFALKKWPVWTAQMPVLD